jgi:hypothetical protein
MKAFTEDCSSEPQQDRMDHCSSTFLPFVLFITLQRIWFREGKNYRYFFEWGQLAVQKNLEIVLWLEQDAKASHRASS